MEKNGHIPALVQAFPYAENCGLTLKLSLGKYKRCNHELIYRYGISVSMVTTDIFRLSEPQACRLITFLNN